MSNNELSIYGNMLADNHIEVIFSEKATTASYNLKSGFITMPIYSFLDEVTNQMLVSHEVGHALFSKYDSDKFQELYGKYGALFNIVEDIFIEKKIKEQYAGLKAVFNTAYNTLWKNDFFGIIKNDVNVNELPLADKINLYFKAGAISGVTFNKEEMVICYDLMKMTTNTDVEIMCERIMEYMKSHNDFDRKDCDDLTNFDNSEYADSNEDSCQYDSYPDEIESEYNEGGESFSRSENSKNSNSESISENGFTSITQKNVEENLKEQSHGNDNISNNNKYYQMTINTNLAPEIHTFKYEQGYKAKTSTSKINMVLNAVARGDSYFRMLKDAKKSRFMKKKQCGSLDSRRLAKYKTTDTIFKMKKITNKEQNHGVVMLIDFSSSMQPCIENVIMQTAIVAQFCKRNGIPFEIIEFGGKSKNEECYINDNVLKLADSSTWNLKNFLSIHHNITLQNTPTIDGLIAVTKSINKMKMCGIDKVHVYCITDGECCGLNVYKYTEQNDNESVYIRNTETKELVSPTAVLFRHARNVNMSVIINGHRYNPVFKRVSWNNGNQTVPYSLFKYISEVMGASVIVNYISRGDSLRYRLNTVRSITEHGDYNINGIDTPFVGVGDDFPMSMLINKEFDTCEVIKDDNSFIKSIIWTDSKTRFMASSKSLEDARKQSKFMKVFLVSLIKEIA